MKKKKKRVMSKGDGNDENTGCAAVPIVFRPRYAYGTAPTNYFGDGITGTIKRLRGEDPYSEPRTARDLMFWTLFQQDFYTTVIMKSPRSLMKHNMWIGVICKGRTMPYLMKSWLHVRRKGSSTLWVSGMDGTKKLLLSFIPQFSLDTTMVKEQCSG